ncbi:MAG: hypothetical protein ACKVHE_24755 [Planctomycetales bacterium]|jgi:integrase
MLYLTATMTVFRASELASLTELSLELTGDSLTITVQAGYSKRRRTDTRPLRADLAKMLQAWLDCRRSHGADSTSAIDEPSTLSLDKFRGTGGRE